MKIEISIKDLILFCLVIALFLFVFMRFIELNNALELAKRQGQIDLNTKNLGTLDQVLRSHDGRILALESEESGPPGKK